MNIRELLKERHWIGLVLAFVAILIAVATAWSALRSGSPTTPMMPSQVFFSDDDGKTYFPDDSKRVSGFDHGGRKAYQAAVFRCGNSPGFVGYLIRFSTDGTAALEAMPDSQRRISNSNFMEIRQSTGMIKRPGDKTWISLGGTTATNQILIPKCPDGSSDVPQQILP